MWLNYLPNFGAKTWKSQSNWKLSESINISIWIREDFARGSVDAERRVGPLLLLICRILKNWLKDCSFYSSRLKQESSMSVEEKQARSVFGKKQPDLCSDLGWKVFEALFGSSSRKHTTWHYWGTNEGDFLHRWYRPQLQVSLLSKMS